MCYRYSEKLEMDVPEGKHEIFRRDPKELMQYVHHRVCLTTVDGGCHTGWVYTVDPVSSTFVLLQYEADGISDESLSRANHAELVLGHAIRSVEMLAGDVNLHRTDMEALFKPPAEMQSVSAEEMSSRCERLRQWLIQNRVPVERAVARPEVLTIGGDVLIIEPPYNIECCLSTNEIILARVQSLVRNMPSSSVANT